MTTQTVFASTLFHSLILSLSLSPSLCLAHSLTNSLIVGQFSYFHVIYHAHDQLQRKSTFIYVHTNYYIIVSTECEHFWFFVGNCTKLQYTNKNMQAKTMCKYHLLLNRVIVPRQRLVLYSFCATIFISSCREPLIWIHYLLPLVRTLFWDSLFLFGTKTNDWSETKIRKSKQL